MKYVASLLLILALLGGCAHGQVGTPANSTLSPNIDIKPLQRGNWIVTYSLANPANQLTFHRSPDKSRSGRWVAPAGFEIINTAQGEVLRRVDQRSFDRVRLQVPAVYRDLPKDYAPFAIFGGGGTLFHTGRFFVCANVCSGDPKWRMRLQAGPSRRIIINGAVLQNSASWIDGDSGRYVYLGNQEPVSTPHFVTVIDQQLPLKVRQQLLEQLPRFMDDLAGRLGPLNERPMLFASYDPQHKPGWGRQGGTLPGQVFTHFYGGRWAGEMEKPNFANDLAWHLAHEAAHLHQRDAFRGKKEDAWIHEGAAEAMAAIVLRGQSPSAAEFAARKIRQAKVDCATSLRGRTIRSTLAAGEFSVSYSCGLILNLAIDKATQSASREGGLFAVWRHFIASKSGDGAEAGYLQSVAATGGAQAAESIRRAANSTQPSLN